MESEPKVEVVTRSQFSMDKVEVPKMLFLGTDKRPSPINIILINIKMYAYGHFVKTIEIILHYEG